MPREVKRSPVVEHVQMEITPLLRFLRAMLTTDMRREFAESCGSTLFYLYQLAAAPDPNPRLQLAKAIVLNSRVYAPKLMTSPLTYDDLLVGQAPRDEPGP